VGEDLQHRQIFKCVKACAKTTPLGFSDTERLNENMAIHLLLLQEFQRCH